MPYRLSEINRRAAEDPARFIAECDKLYASRISRAVGKIISNLENSPIVLLSGPSGSGKTTTAMKIEDELQRRGYNTHTISMDNYFKTVDLRTAVRTAEGTPDLESPACMDMELLNDHFTMLSRGERIFVPRYEFSRQMRVIDPSKSLRLGKNDIAVFEGIHALNDSITDVHPEAFKLYISAASDVRDDDNKLFFKRSWMRLLRRTVRDNLFRGADAASTVSMWANVRRGEKAYISPFKGKADYKFDSSFAYEVCVLKTMAGELFNSIPDDVERGEELRTILPALEQFESIDASLVPPDSLLREFIGGGIYEY